MAEGIRNKRDGQIESAETAFNEALQLAAEERGLPFSDGMALAYLKQMMPPEALSGVL